MKGTVARMAADLLARICELTVAIERLGREIAELVGESAGVSRFRSAAAFARHNGSAPVPVWSGDPTRHRLSRGGNRQLNAALHRIAVTSSSGAAAAATTSPSGWPWATPGPRPYEPCAHRSSDRVFRRMRRD